MVGPVRNAQGSLDVGASWRDGAQALRGGRPLQALAAFTRIVDAGRADATVWLGIAAAHGRLGDDARHLAALDRALALDPQNIRILMLKGDHYARSGDPIAAASFYAAVESLGAVQPQPAPDLAAEVARARAARAGFAQAFEAHVRETLGRAGLDRPGARRVADSVDLMLGAKTIYPQQPTQYYFPELPQIQFYDRDASPWLDAVEAATDDIREELLAVMRDDAAFTPYVESEADRPFFDRDKLLANPEWSAFFLWKSGRPVPGQAERCPKTMAALEGAPLCRIPGRTPSILFSLLKPGASIPPHHGLLNTRLIGHLPLIVPPGCGFRVGNDVRAWEEGRAWLFDDSIEHEAWNRSDHTRVVLIFDVWRPELTDLERELVTAVLEASDKFAGKRTELGV